MKKTIIRQLLVIIKTFIFPLILWSVFAAISLALNKTSFISSAALDKIARDSVLTTIIAFAVGLPLSSGRWDFGAGAIMILAGIIGSNITIIYNLGIIGLIMITLITAIVLAMFEGFVYVTFKIPTLIISLVIVMIYEALSGILFGGQGSQLYLYKNLTIFARSPWIYIVFCIVALGFWYINKYTKFSYHIKALGEDPEQAVNQGINERKIVLITYLIVGGLLGIAAIINASISLVAPASNLSSTALMFTSMGPVLIGLFLAKYSNMTLGILSGSLTMNTLAYAMISLGNTTAVQTIVLGVFITGFMGYTTNMKTINSWIRNIFQRKKLQHEHFESTKKKTI